MKTIYSNTLLRHIYNVHLILIQCYFIIFLCDILKRFILAGLNVSVQHFILNQGKCRYSKNLNLLTSSILTLQCDTYSNLNDKIEYKTDNHLLLSAIQILTTSVQFTIGIISLLLAPQYTYKIHNTNMFVRCERYKPGWRGVGTETTLTHQTLFVRRLPLDR